MTCLKHSIYNLKLYFNSCHTIVVAMLFCMAATTLTASTIDVYATYNSVAGKFVPRQLSDAIGKKMREEGFVHDKTTLISPKAKITPLLYFDQNTNGGNPSNVLTLGNISFRGNEDLKRRGGIVTGLRGSLKYRHSTGWGKYFDIEATASNALSIEHHDKISVNSLKLCSINYIKDWTYIDLCHITGARKKELNFSRTINNKVKFTKFVDFGESKYGEISTAYGTRDNGEYRQNIYSFGLQALLPTRRISLDLDYGGKSNQLNKHTLQYSGKLSSSFSVMERKGNIALSISKFSGSKLFGFPRTDTAKTLTVSTNILSNVNLQFGYHKNASSIDYYTDEYPIISFNFIN